MRCHGSRVVLRLLFWLVVFSTGPDIAGAQTSLRATADVGGGAAGRAVEPAFGYAVRITWMVHIDPSAWDTSANFAHGCFVMDQMATLIEAHGGFMCVATSRPFMDACLTRGNGPTQPGSLGDLAARGHEIAYHPHSGDAVADTVLIRRLTQAHCDADWPTHIEGGGAHADLVVLGYRTGTGCGKDRASQLFAISQYPYRPVEGECYGQDPSGPLISLGGGASDGAGQASDNTDEMLAALQYAIDRRRSDKLSFVDLTVTHPDDWLASSAAEVLADFQQLDQWMTDEIDPLLASGQIAWATPTEKGELFEQWEQYGGDNSDLFPEPSVTDSDWSWLDSSNSPLTSDVFDEVLFDSSGRLWFGAADEAGGLVRFDAGTWTHFTSSGSPLRADRVTALAEGLSGDIWVGVFASGPGTSTALQRFDGSSWTTFDSSNSPLPDPFLFDVAVDPAGIVWASGKSGLYRYDGSTWVSYTSSNSPLPARQRGVTDIEAYSATGLYLALRTGGVMHFEHQGDALPWNDVWTLHDRMSSGSVLPADTIHAVALHPDGDLYAGTLRGLSIMSGGSWQTHTSASSELGYDQICDIEFDDQGRVWLATFGGGLARFDPTTQAFENFDIPAGTVHGRYNNSLAIGPLGDVFAASMRAGGISIYTGP